MAVVRLVPGYYRTIILPCRRLPFYFHCERHRHWATDDPSTDIRDQRVPTGPTTAGSFSVANTVLGHERIRYTAN